MEINYSIIVNNYIEIIKYCIKSSDTFSVISNIKKPYSQIPPKSEHDEILKYFEPYLLKQVIGIKNWPGTSTRDNHKVISIYKCQKETYKLLMNLPNIFTPLSNNLPEDICFYRNDMEWLVSVSHEKLAYISHETKQDAGFFQGLT